MALIGDRGEPPHATIPRERLTTQPLPARGANEWNCLQNVPSVNIQGSMN